MAQSLSILANRAINPQNPIVSPHQREARNLSLTQLRGNVQDDEAKRQRVAAVQQIVREANGDFEAAGLKVMAIDPEFGEQLVNFGRQRKMQPQQDADAATERDRKTTKFNQEQQAYNLAEEKRKQDEEAFQQKYNSLVATGAPRNAQTEVELRQQFKADQAKIGQPPDLHNVGPNQTAIRTDTMKPVFTGPPSAGDETPEEKFIGLKLREEATKFGGSLSAQQESAARQAARAEWTDAGRENKPQMDELSLRIKELQIGQAEERLKAMKGDGGMTPAQLTSAMSLSNGLKSHQAYQEMLSISGSKQAVDIGLNQKNGFGDITAINGFQRMVDPGVSVREGDVALLQSGASMVAKILSDFPIQKLQSGAKLPDSVREQMRTVANELYERRAGNYNESVGSQYRQLAEAAKIPFAYIGTDFPVTPKKANAAAGGAAPKVITETLIQSNMRANPKLTRAQVIEQLKARNVQESK